MQGHKKKYEFLFIFMEVFFLLIPLLIFLENLLALWWIYLTSLKYITCKNKHVTGE